tara:strand:+ start:61 stop:1311 length:1251 start_codon:yes stop_codon:yes gene_type:complete
MAHNLRQNTWSLNENYAEVEEGDIGYKDNAGGNTLWAWGFNQYAGQLAQNDTVNRSSPTQIGSGTDWSQQCVSAGGPASRPHCYAVKTNGSLYAWGSNTYGQLAQNNTTPYYSSPVQIPGTTWSTDRGKLSPGAYGDIAAIKTNGTLWVWGAGTYGKLGQNQPQNTDYSSPVQIPGTYSWCSMSKADVGSFIKTNGELWMTGAVRSYLGSHVTLIGGHANRSSPCQLPGTNWRSTHWDQDGTGIFMTKTDGTLWFMGEYHSGQSGQGLPSSAFEDNYGQQPSSPIQIPGTTWTTKISIMDKGVAAIKTDGSLWTWGNNSRGRLGHNDKYAQVIDSPRQVGTDLNWESCQMQMWAVAATKTDGTLWTWGGGIYGVLGQNYEDDWESSKSSPVQVPGIGWSVRQQSCQSSVRATKSVN